MYDAIIILGSSRIRLLNFRCDKALALYEDDKAPRIVITGTPSEVRTAKLRLVPKGVAPENLFFEVESNDTIENAFFTKTTFLDTNNWRKILIVTSDFHVERAEYVFDKILGDKYEFEVIGTATGMSEVETSNELQKEAKKLKWTKINL